MLNFIKKIFPSGGGNYEAQKQKLDSGDPQQLLKLARNENTQPEILYLLASNPSVDIRRAVVMNKSAPAHIASIMSKDANPDVRLLLVARLVALLPSLSEKEHSQLYAYAVQAMGALAQDEVVQIRKALSSALQDYAEAPPEVVARLARDVERAVSEPILRFCLALADSEILDIISSHPAPWVLGSIAGRAKVSSEVSDAIIEADHVPAIATLLQNPASTIGLEKLYDIIERARDNPDWHRPIAMRREMSTELAHRLAGFVDKTILEVLEKRSDFDSETRKGVAELVKRRLEYRNEGTPVEAAASRVERYANEKRLTPEVIRDALMWHDAEFVILALSFLAAIHPQIVRRMIETQKAKPVVALCRKANLPMRLAVDIQRYLAKVPMQEIMYAKEGTDYPMPDSDIKWQLEFFGIQGPLS